MDNKDHLNQIPGEANDSQDEKTSKTENQNVDASKPENADEKKQEEPTSTAEEKQPDIKPDKTPVDESNQQDAAEEKTPPEPAKQTSDANVAAEESTPETAKAESPNPEEPEKPEGETKSVEPQPEAASDEKTEEPAPEKQEPPVETKAEDSSEEKVEAAPEEESNIPVAEKEEQAEDKKQDEKQEGAEVEEASAKKTEEPAQEKPEPPVEAKADDSSIDEKDVETEQKLQQPEADAQEEPTQEVAKEEPETEVVAEAEKPSDKSETEVAANTEKEVSDDHDGSDEDHDDEDEEHEPEEDVDYNTLSREELVAHLEELVAAEDVNSIKSKVSQIKVAYLKKTKAEKEAQIDQSFTGDDDSEEKEEAAPVEDALEVKFNELFDIYKQKRAIFLENLEKQKLENLEKKKQILEDLKELIASEETLKKTYDDFRELQDKWKEIGMVPKSEVNNLWQNYHFLVEKFFDKVKINKELKDLDLKKNLEQKIELCEKAEELLLENSIIKSFKELQRLHEQWKEIGPVPADKNEDLWERFKSTTDKINQRRREHYKQLQEQHEKNYEAKVGLCEKAEELLPAEVKTIRDWQNKTKQFNELFRVWKTIGPAAKKQNDEIWERFKTALDTFFKDKKEYFAKLKEQQINNYNLKLDLCVRAEGIKDSTDWKQTTRELINLQKEWKEIGPVPRKHSDKIWKRFRAACDEFFNRKADHFSHIREEEQANLEKKEALIKQVEETEYGSDRNENLNMLKDFQRKWTEIGFVPFRDKDRLQNAFRSAVDKQLDKLNISSTEVSIENYKSKMEVLKGTQDGNKSLGRERIFLQGKISKLRDDIHVWENNIGFLADSKKASLFKDEFEKKIEKARKELEVLEAKLKFLNK